MAQIGNLIVNGVTRLLSKLYVSDSVTAPTFIGKLQGNADTATKVNGHTVNADVPSGAKFTDTTYSKFTGSQSSTAGSVGLVPAPAAGAATRFLRCDGNWIPLGSASAANKADFAAADHTHTGMLLVESFDSSTGTLKTKSSS